MLRSNAILNCLGWLVNLGGELAEQSNAGLDSAHAKLNALLAKLPDEDHGWASALWLFSPTRKLDGARPADIFQANPDAVIDAARRDFEGDDTDW